MLHRPRPAVLSLALVAGLATTLPAQATAEPAARGRARTPPPQVVINGIDVLVADGFKALAGRKIGLISNHTGRDARGLGTAELLHAAENVELKILFSPEHGYAGTQDAKVGHAVHRPTGLPIHSLYTADRRPDAASLRGLDTLVFDIQDIGCRFYTYISTMGEAMQAAATHRLRFVVLDRPNPINGIEIGGAMRDPDQRSFVAWHTIPVRHGMTTGELAQMFNRECDIDCDLQVVQMQGWQRRFFFDATGQTWIDPSPNMRSPTQALLYPGVGLLETTNLSVGRGTDTPFEVIGAPWLDGPLLAHAINAAELLGLRCVPIRFVPRGSKFAGETCSGIRFCITNRDAFDPVILGVHLAVELRRLHPDVWQTKGYRRLLVNQKIQQMIEGGATAAKILQEVHRQLHGFYQRREACLLYR
jgi:uncharacterized protein YbbC (DUF1343 family)